MHSNSLLQIENEDLYKSTIPEIKSLKKILNFSENFIPQHTKTRSSNIMTKNNIKNTETSTMVSLNENSTKSIKRKPVLKLSTPFFKKPSQEKLNPPEFPIQLKSVPNLHENFNKKKILILEESKNRYYGIIKYFEERKNYGFIKVDDLNTEIFFHFDDIKTPGVTVDFITSYREGKIIRVSFQSMSYIGKYKNSRKAIEINIL